MNSNQLQKLINQAQLALQSNRLVDARNCYMKISKHMGGDPGTWVALGAIEARLGSYKKAGDFFKKVIMLSPEQVEGYLNLAKTQYALGEFSKARKNFEKSLLIQPNLTEALMMLANVHGQLLNYSEAIQGFKKVLEQNNNIAAAHFGMASCYLALNEYFLAEQSYNNALQLQASYPEVLNGLGFTVQKQERLDDAISYYKRAIEQHPGYAIAYYNLGTALNQLDLHVEASHAFDQAIQINPKYVEAYVNLGRVLSVIGTNKASISCYRKALEIDPDNVDALVNMGRSIALEGDYNNAYQLYQKAESLNPEKIEAIAGQAAVLERQGLFDEAAALLQPKIDAGNKDFCIIITFATLSRRIGQLEKGRLVLEDVLSNSTSEISWRERSSLYFSLANIYQDQKLYDLAFEQFRRANELLPYHFIIDDHKEYINKIIMYGSRDFLKNLPRAKLNTSRPIFIVGMPRSGTSLIEQIIASHPQVFGGGELNFIDECSNEMEKLINTSQSFPASIGELSQNGIDKLAQHYLSQLNDINTEARYVTDKMPHNFLSLGLISLMCPQAKVIHCKRNPIDTCLSIYTHNFTANHPYSVDLEHLGQYYQEYERLLQHWNSNLDIPVFELQYEEIISDQENLTRKLIEFCGLDWDESCMDFHKSGREVTTPSYDQVRQPIYKDAVERWRHYEDYLLPLQNALSDKY